MALASGFAFELMWDAWMRRALALAALADGHTSPNPLVGAVVLDRLGRVVAVTYTQLTLPTKLLL